MWHIIDHNFGRIWRPLRMFQYVSSRRRNKENLKKWSPCQLADVKECHSIFGNTILTMSGRHSTALLCVFSCFWGQGLVQLVIARPSMLEVSSSMPKCDIQSLFRLLSFPCIALSSCKYPWNGALIKVLEGWGWDSGLVRRWSWLFRGADVKLRALTFYLLVGKNYSSSHGTDVIVLLMPIRSP